MPAVALSDVCFTRAPEPKAATGLLGWVRFRAGDLLIDGVAVRRTRSGRVGMSWPKRLSPSGAEYSYVRPVDDPARREIEAQVLDALGFGEEVA